MSRQIGMRAELAYGYGEEAVKYNVIHASKLNKVGMMVLHDYPNFVEKTARPVNRQGGLEKLTDDEAKVILSYTGLAGEAGEVAEYFKKFLLHGKPEDKDALKKEMGDVLWYLFLMCNMCDLPFQDVLEANMKKLSARHLENPEHAEHHDFFRKLLAS